MEASLAAQGIYSQDGGHPVAMETDDDNINSDTKVLSDVSSRVGLWPVCEHIALCAEQVSLNKILAVKVQRYTLFTFYKEGQQGPMGDFQDAWWQQTYQVKFIVLGNVRMLRTM